MLRCTLSFCFCLYFHVFCDRNFNFHHQDGLCAEGEHIHKLMQNVVAMLCIGHIQQIITLWSWVFDPLLRHACRRG